jgi:N-acetylneuraminic acid mutarotase
MHYGSPTTSGETLRDIRRYDPENDRWAYIGILPEGIINHVSFAIGKQVYIGLGEVGEEWKASRELYRFEE